MIRAVIDRLLDDGHAFAVCYCGHLVHFTGCAVCGYVLPEVRERREQDRTRDLLDEWNRDARAAIVKRRRQTWARRLRHRRKTRTR